MILNTGSPVSRSGGVAAGPAPTCLLFTSHRPDNLVADYANLAYHMAMPHDAVTLHADLLLYCAACQWGITSSRLVTCDRHPEHPLHRIPRLGGGLSS